MLVGEVLGKLDIGIGLGAHLVLRDGEVAGHSVDGAGLELHEGGVVIADGLERGEGGSEVGLSRLVAREHVIGGRVGLRDDVLAGKIGEALDAAALLHDDDLSIQHVGIGEGVVVLAAFHGEAVPDASDGAGVEERVLCVPIDGLELDVPAVAAGNLGSEVEVEAGEVAVVADETVRWIRLVEADDERRLIRAGRSRVLLVVRSVVGGATSQQARRQGEGAYRCCHYLQFLHEIPSFAHRALSSRTVPFPVCATALYCAKVLPVYHRYPPVAQAVEIIRPQEGQP